MKGAVGGAIGFPIPAAARLPLLAGGEAPGCAPKRERRRLLQPGKPFRRVHGDWAGIASREHQRGAIHLCGVRAIRAPFRYTLPVLGMSWYDFTCLKHARNVYTAKLYLFDHSVL